MWYIMGSLPVLSNIYKKQDELAEMVLLTLLCCYLTNQNSTWGKPWENIYCSNQTECHHNFLFRKFLLDEKHNRQKCKCWDTCKTSNDCVQQLWLLILIYSKSVLVVHLIHAINFFYFSSNHGSVLNVLCYLGINTSFSSILVWKWRAIMFVRSFLGTTVQTHGKLH